MEVEVEIEVLLTSCMNFLHTGRMSLLSVAENIMTCLPCGVLRKISCTSRRMSEKKREEQSISIVLWGEKMHSAKGR